MGPSLQGPSWQRAELTRRILKLCRILKLFDLIGICLSKMGNNNISIVRVTLNNNHMAVVLGY